MKILSRSSLLLMVPFFLSPLVIMAEESPLPAVQEVSYLGFGTRLGEGMVEGYADLIFPLFATPSNTFFLNPRFSLKDEGENEVNIGLGYRRRLTDWLVGGANLYFDSRESAHNNRFNQWGAGLEVLTEYIDFRANYYDADNDKELIGSYGETSVARNSRTTASSKTRSSTTATTHSHAHGTSDPYAEGHGIYYDIFGEIITDYITTATTTTTYRTTTTTTTTRKLFEQFEAGMDGWDTELGLKIPIGSGPEIRLYGGWYDYDNPCGDDISGVKGRLEIKTGAYFTLGAEVFDDDELNDSNYFVGFRLQIPLSADLSWQKFREGLFGMRHRSLDERMRSEMVMRDVRIQTEESDWQENLEKRQVDVKKSVAQRSTTSTRTTSSTTSKSGVIKQVQVADHITFVDGDTSGAEDGTNENPYSTIQKAVDNAGDNNTIFVYETGGTATGKPGPGDGGGFYDEQVVLKEGQTLTSTVSWTSHGGGSYQTTNLPIIKPTTRPASGWKTYPFGGWGAPTAPVVAMAAETTVRSMAVDASGFTGFGTDWGATSGLFVNINDSQNVGLRVEENQITTSQYGSFGILFEINRAQGSLIDLRANSIVTSGELADAIVVNALSSNDVNLNISGGEVTTLGPDVYEITLYADNSRAITFNVSGGEITAQGANGSRGIYIELENAEAANVDIVGGTITGQGDGFAGIYVSALNSTAVNDTIAGNVFNVEGANSWGIYVKDDTANSFDQAGLEANNIFSITDPATSVEVEVN